MQFSRLADELSRLLGCKWARDEENVVLEVTEPDKKGTYDADMCTWRELLREMEETGNTDVTINSHELVKPLADGISVNNQKFMMI